MTITITPMAPGPGAPAVHGNVYRFRVTDQSGRDLAPAGGSSFTVVLREPPNVVDARMSALAGGTWQDLPTQSGGLSGIVSANVDHLGDFAITGTTAAGLSGIATPLLALAAIVGIGSVLVLAFVARGSRKSNAPVPVGDRRRSAAGGPNERRRRRGSRR